MIRLVEVLNYRCLRYVRQEIDHFQILVGPNGSGKSTFIDTVRFLGQLVSNGLDAAIADRTTNLSDLLWQDHTNRFEFAIETDIPSKYRAMIENQDLETCRYEVAIGIDSESKENSILSEKVIMSERRPTIATSVDLFPRSIHPPDTVSVPTGRKGTKTIVNKVSGGNDNFYDETGKGWDHAFKLGRRKSALGNLPEDESRFPVSTWLKKTLVSGIETLILNSQAMRRPSAPGLPKDFRADGSNLPWVIEELRKKDPDRYQKWVEHVQTAIPGIEEIKTFERPEDKHRYLTIAYRQGQKVPSWNVSDGTLRLLALTLIAYMDDPGRIWLIEEPENGIHPRAVETVFQSLSSTYDCQILCASHSPVVLSLADPSQILCFALTKEGATDIVSGSFHPVLKNWKKGTDLGTLFAAGVLG